LRNNDFRKTVKFIKRWKHNYKEKYDDFELKSFHIEQVVYLIFTQNQDIEIADAVFKFFCDIPKIISRPQIGDRADHNQFIDEYVTELSKSQKKKIKEARDYFLIEFENITSRAQISNLLIAYFYQRACAEERYLFDDLIPTYIEEDKAFEIDGYLSDRNGFRKFTYQISDSNGIVKRGNEIRFQIKQSVNSADLFKWKVKNDNSCDQPRGEITNGKTRNDPERTEYDGNHYVECFAIKNNVCIAKSKIPVIIQ